MGKEQNLTNSSKSIPSHAQVVIIGGGVIGCSLAYHLTKLGWKDILLLEKTQLTAGTTWHAAGLIVSGFETETTIHMAKYTRDLYERLGKETGQETGFKPIGYLQPATNSEQNKISKNQVLQPKTKTQKEKLAWLNRIDFASEEAGKSALIIGTTRPVDYQLTKISDKRLRLDLLDTNLPEYRNRALITTRFQSAVDRITPTQQADTKNTVVVIELRESVPYLVKQTDNIIKVDFSASSIPDADKTILTGRSVARRVARITACSESVSRLTTPVSGEKRPSTIPCTETSAYWWSSACTTSTPPRSRDTLAPVPVRACLTALSVASAVASNRWRGKSKASASPVYRPRPSRYNSRNPNEQ